jgi:hypothetical protein
VVVIVVVAVADLYLKSPAAAPSFPEPDLYALNGIRNLSFGWNGYATEFGQYAAALAPLLPAPRIQGGALCCFFQDDVVAFVQSHTSVLSSFSQHEYPLLNCWPGPKNANTIYDLLSNAATDAQAARVAPFVQAAVAVGVPYVIGEGNSCGCGGQVGLNSWAP